MAKIFERALSLIASLLLVTCGRQPTASSLSEVQPCGRTESSSQTCGNRWKQWDFRPLRTGRYGQMDAVGTANEHRYSPPFDNRGENWFVFGPYLDTGRVVDSMTAVIEFEASAVIDTDQEYTLGPIQVGTGRQFKVKDISEQVYATPAFSIDFVAVNADGTSQSLGQRTYYFRDFNRDGYRFSLPRTSAAFTTNARGQYREVQVRIFGVDGQLDIRAYRTTISTQY